MTVADVRVCAAAKESFPPLAHKSSMKLRCVRSWRRRCVSVEESPDGCLSLGCTRNRNTSQQRAAGTFEMPTHPNIQRGEGISPSWPAALSPTHTPASASQTALAIVVAPSPTMFPLLILTTSAGRLRLPRPSFTPPLNVTNAARQCWHRAKPLRYLYLMSAQAILQYGMVYIVNASIHVKCDAGAPYSWFAERTPPRFAGVHRVGIRTTSSYKRWGRGISSNALSPKLQQQFSNLALPGSLDSSSNRLAATTAVATDHDRRGDDPWYLPPASVTEMDPRCRVFRCTVMRASWGGARGRRSVLQNTDDVTAKRQQ